MLIATIHEIKPKQLDTYVSSISHT